MADTGIGGRVRRGMEIVGWRYNAEEWQAHVDYLLTLVRARERRLQTLSGATIGIGGLLILVLVALTQLGSEDTLLVGGAATAIGVGAWAAIAWRRTRAVDALHRQILSQPPEVRLTSSGMIFGNEVRLWRGRKERLLAARCADEGPGYLQLTFGSGPDGHERLLIPLPPVLRDQAPGIVETLAGIASGAGPPPQDLQLPADSGEEV